MDSALRKIVYVSTAIMPIDSASIEKLPVDSRDYNTYQRNWRAPAMWGCDEGRGHFAEEGRLLLQDA